MRPPRGEATEVPRACHSRRPPRSEALSLSEATEVEACHSRRPPRVTRVLTAMVKLSEGVSMASLRNLISVVKDPTTTMALSSYVRKRPYNNIGFMGVYRGIDQKTLAYRLLMEAG